MTKATICTAAVVMGDMITTSKCNNQPLRNTFVMYFSPTVRALSTECGSVWDVSAASSTDPARHESTSTKSSTPHMSPIVTCAVVLAAGAGSRFDGSSHKLLAVLGEQSVYRWALDAVRAAGLDHVVVVTGSVALDLPSDVIEAHNDQWADGQATSLQAGIVAATTLGADAVVVGLGDQPFVTPEAWRAVAAADSPIAVATYAGKRGNPVRLHRSIWSLLPTAGDQGARSLIALRPELVAEVACTGSPADIDTMEDLRQWNSSTNSQ